MKLRVVTKEIELLNTDVERVVLPGQVGQMEILPGHAKLVSLLKNGEIKYFTSGQMNQLTIDSGLAEAANDKITVLLSNKEQENPA